MSDQQIAISEIGVSFPDDSFGQGTGLLFVSQYLLNSTSNIKY
jgi:hypothetical protein